MQWCFLTAVAVGVFVIPHCFIAVVHYFSSLMLSSVPGCDSCLLISAVFSVVPSGVPYCCSMLLFPAFVPCCCPLLLIPAVVSFNSFVCWPSANCMTNSAEIPGVISLSHKLQVFVFLPTGIWPVNICRTGPTSPYPGKRGRSRNSTTELATGDSSSVPAWLALHFPPD